MSPSAASPRIRSGRILALFAFDVAYAIDLEAVPSVLRPGRARLKARKPAPAYVTYTEAPVEIGLGERSLELGGKEVKADVTARLFDFGGVSLTWTWPLPERLDQLPDLAVALAQSESADRSRQVLNELLSEIRPALQGAGDNDLVEDYYIFQIDALEPELGAETLLHDHGETLATILTMEEERLSRQQIEESLRDWISFTPDDLVVAGWNAAFVHDDECEDTLLVLDFLNVQLVELRLLDRQLDAALTRYSTAVYHEPGVLSAVRGPHRQAIREMSESMVEAQHLSERVENAFKLAPDVYLSRVHRRAAARLGFETWERLVRSKLEAMRHLTSVLVERAAAMRTEVLELTIIALIALEIVLALIGAMS